MATLSVRSHQDVMKSATPTSAVEKEVEKAESTAGGGGYILAEKGRELRRCKF